jgi:trigger factor
MSVVVSYEEESPCRRKLTVEVPQPAVEAEMGRVVRDFRRKAKLPGFRAGKVPEAVVRKRYRQEIDREVIERLMPRYWQQAQAEKSLDPLSPPEIEKVELEEGRPMTFVASVDIRPKIELGELDGFELPERDVEPSDGEYQEALDDLRRMRGDWKTVDRAAAHGDQVVGKAVVVEEGEARGEAHPLQVEVGGRGVPEEVTLAFTGAAAGREVTLRRKEFDLLAALARRDGAVVSRVDLLDDVWGLAPDDPGREQGLHSLEVHVAALRGKLDAPGAVLTVRGVGYRLAAGESTGD